MKRIFILIPLFIGSFASAQTPPSNPLFINSIVSTDIDFIKENDSDVSTSISYKGQDIKEMPDSRGGDLMDNKTFVFEASFSNGKKVGIWCHSTFGSQEAAKKYADKLLPRLGKLPELMRDKLSHVIIHKGDAGAFAESLGHFFMLYSDNMDTRISNNDLEETVFHESVHAALDEKFSNTEAWRQAQKDDGNFITDYAQSRSSKEDLAETTIFAYTMMKYPGRLSSETENWAKTHIPNRLAYIEEVIFPELSLSVDNFTFDRSAAALKVYPNPANDIVNVEVEKTVKGSELTVYSITGVLMKTLKTKIGNNEIDIKELSQGVYFVNMPGYRATKIVKL